MRHLILLAGVAALAGCTSAGAPQPVTKVAVRSDFTAFDPHVDLKSPDGVLFLQSPHTGFLEVPDIEQPIPPAPAPVRTAENGRIVTGRPLVKIYAAPPIEEATPPRPPGSSDLPLAMPSAEVPATGSLGTALASAYDANPALNRARANLRAADEQVAVQRAGGRPTVSASIGQSALHVRDVNAPIGGGDSSTLSDVRYPTTVALNVSQPLFQGFRVRNATLQAEANVSAERARLAATEQDVLLNAALAFLDVRRFRDGAKFRRQEVDFLVEQVGNARDRLRFGEGTQTDIDQAEARLAQVQAFLVDEETAARDAEARFRELTGLEPSRLRFDVDPAKLLPRNVGEALTRAQAANPDIALAIHEADEAMYQVKVVEGQSLPTVSLTGRAAANVNTSDADRNEQAEVRLQVEVPIYQGGRVSAQVRQAKEQLGSARINVDLQRDAARSDLTSAWATYTGSIAAINAANSSVAAARRAVAGLLEELSVGQRTTVDVLDAQSDLVAAEITRLQAQRQRDGAAFTILRRIGELSAASLGLDVVPYVPAEHYAAVKDKWAGMRVPDGL